MMAEWAKHVGVFLEAWRDKGTAMRTTRADRCMAMVCSVALNHVKEAWTADGERPTREKARARNGQRDDGESCVGCIGGRRGWWELGAATGFLLLVTAIA